MSCLLTFLFTYVGDLSFSSNYSNTSSSLQEYSSIFLPPSLFQQFLNDSFTLMFTMYNSSVLLPQANETRPKFAVASTVIGATVADHDIVDLNDNITLVMHLEFPVRIELSVILCVLCCANNHLAFSWVMNNVYKYSGVPRAVLRVLEDPPQRKVVG